MILQIGMIKARLRKHVERSPDRHMVLIYEHDCVRVHDEAHAMGIILDLIPGQVLNQDGDYMTEEEIQEVVDKLQVIVDEHNSHLQ